MCFALKTVFAMCQKGLGKLQRFILTLYKKKVLEIVKFICYITIDELHDVSNQKRYFFTMLNLYE